MYVHGDTKVISLIGLDWGSLNVWGKLLWLPVPSSIDFDKAGNLQHQSSHIHETRPRSLMDVDRNGLSETESVYQRCVNSTDDCS